MVKMSDSLNVFVLLEADLKLCEYRPFETPFYFIDIVPGLFNTFLF